MYKLQKLAVAQMKRFSILWINPFDFFDNVPSTADVNSADKMFFGGDIKANYQNINLLSNCGNLHRFGCLLLLLSLKKDNK